MDIAGNDTVPSNITVGSAAEQYFGNLTSYSGQLQFIPESLSPKSETRLAREAATRVARHTFRTSEPVRGGTEKHVDMVIGPRLLCQPAPDWDLLGPAFAGDANKKVRKAFSDQCRAQFMNWAFDPALTQDAEQHYTFGGLMWQAYHNLRGPDAETAGVILRDEDRRIAVGSRWSTFVNVIHPGRVRTPPLKEGDADRLAIFDGRQLDGYGGWEGLYILNRHPKDPMIRLDDFTFVSRRDENGQTQAWHWFEKTEGGAQRGLTKLVTSFRHTGMFDKHDDAMLGQAVLEALFGMHVKSNADPQTIAERLAPPAESPGDNLRDWRLGFYEKIKLRFGGKRVAVLPEGDELKINAVERAASDPTAFLNHFMRRFASVTGTTFEQISNNWSDANYSAARAALLDLWRAILRCRELFIFIPSIIYQAVISEAIERGYITLPAGAPDFFENRTAYTRVNWTGPAVPQIDPEKEAKAQDYKLRNRTTNRQIEAAQSGLDYYDVLSQFGTEIEEADDLGFELEPPLPGANAGGDPDATAEDGPTPSQSRRKPAKKDE